MTLSIEIGNNNKSLRTICEKVTIFDQALKDLVQEMEHIMKLPDPITKVKGVGIAANQVGISKQLCLVTFNLNTKRKQKVVPMINVEIIELSNQKVWLEEGCLSVPKLYGKVSRSTNILVKWQNLEGNFCEKKLKGWDARIVLHEIDHLQGKLFTDYPLKSTKENA